MNTSSQPHLEAVVEGDRLLNRGHFPSHLAATLLLAGSVRASDTSTSKRTALLKLQTREIHQF